MKPHTIMETIFRRWTALVALAAFCLGATFGCAQDEKTPPVTGPKKISTVETTNHYGKFCIVTGKVVGVKITENRVFIDLDKPYPETLFSAVVFSDTTNKFGDLKSLEGKNVEIKGEVKSYRAFPRIVLNSADQLKVETDTPNEAQRSNQPPSRP